MNTTSLYEKMKRVLENLMYLFKCGFKIILFDLQYKLLGVMFLWATWVIFCKQIWFYDMINADQ